MTNTTFMMVCSPVRRDNPRALASGLSPVQVDNHGIAILCISYTLRDNWFKQYLFK